MPSRRDLRQGQPGCREFDGRHGNCRGLVATGVRYGIDALRARHQQRPGPALLYAANLLGILIGGITVLAIREPYFRDKLRRRRRSRLPVLVDQKLYGRYEQYR